MTGPRFLPGLKVSMVISFLDMKVYILLRSYKFNLCLNLNIFDLNLQKFNFTNIKNLQKLINFNKLSKMNQGIFYAVIAKKKSIVLVECMNARGNFP